MSGYRGEAQGLPGTPMAHSFRPVVMAPIDTQQEAGCSYG